MNNTATSQTTKAKSKKKPKLPRGLRWRGDSIVAYLTHPDGRGERRVIGNVTVAMARQQREIWMRDLIEEKYIKKQPRAKKVPFSVAADCAVTYAQNYKATWDGETGRVKLLKSWFEGRTIDTITTEEIDAKLLENLAPRGLKWSEATSNEYRLVLLTIFRLAIKRGEISANPASATKHYRLNNARVRELSYQEETRLMDAVRSLHPAKEPELLLALHLGARASNLYGIFKRNRKPMPPLDWKDVDLDWKVVRFPRSKGGASYSVPINSIALRAFQELRERSDGTGPVIRKASGREVHSSRKWFEKCLAAAGIEDFCWHDLRHTFGTRLRRNGVRIEDIAALLGHGIAKEYRMTARYAHIDAQTLRTAVETLVPTDTKTDTLPIVQFPHANAV